MLNIPPFVSIVIAAFNGEKHIERAIDSCLRQTYPYFEVVVVNDGSTDSTRSIVEEYCKQDSRIKLFELENGGQGRARNFGLQNCNSKYITILDSDDELNDVALDKLVAAAEQNDSDLVFSEWSTFDHVKRIRNYSGVFGGLARGKLSSYDRERLFLATYYSVAKLYKREFLTENNILYGEGYIYEDMEFLIGVYLKANVISAIPDPVYIIHVNEHSSTRINKNGKWHAESFESAVTNTLKKYEGEFSSFGKKYIQYVMGRLPFYGWFSKRIPLRYRASFIAAIVMKLNEFNTRHRYYSVSTRYGFIFKVSEKNKYAAAILVLVSHKVAKNKHARKLFEKAKAGWTQYKKYKLKRKTEKARRSPFDDELIIMHGFDYELRGNSKYLFEALASAGFKVVIALNKVEKAELPMNVRCIRFLSNEYHQLHQRARFHIFESWTNPILGKRAGAYWVQLWHGTPLKKMLLDSEERDVMKRSPMHKLNKSKDIAKWDLLIAQNKISKSKFLSSFGIPSANVAITGYPRTDFFNTENSEIVTNIREKYNIPPSKKILLYATTWRDYNQYTTVKDQSYLFDFEKTPKLQEEFHVLYVGHPFGKDKAPRNMVAAVGDDFQHLLLSADCLITDYSSAVFDYLKLDRPFCLFMSDYEKFDKSRGIYDDIEKDFFNYISYDEEQAESLLLSWKSNSEIQNKGLYDEPKEISSADKIASILLDVRNNF